MTSLWQLLAVKLIHAECVLDYNIVVRAKRDLLEEETDRTRAELDCYDEDLQSSIKERKQMICEQLYPAIS
eukprot:13259580-Heterocapsa_arctica.AAC.1